MTFEAPSSGRFRQMLLCLTVIPGSVPEVLKAGNVSPPVSGGRYSTLENPAQVPGLGLE